MFVYSVTSAWIGVNALNGPHSFVSDPEGTLSYVPTWAGATDAAKKCVSVLAGSGEWEALECKGSGSNKRTLSRIPPMDESGYNLETGKINQKETCIFL